MSVSTIVSIDEGDELFLQHLALFVCPCSPHLSQTNFDRNRFSMGSLSEANLTKMSTTLSSNEHFLARFSLYFLFSLLQASEPYSEKHFKPCPKFKSFKISSE